MKTTKPRKTTRLSSIAIGCLAIIATFFLTACGSTSALKNPQGTSELTSSTRKFSKVTVQDFTSPLAGVKVSPAKKYFADQIAAQLRRQAKFSSVTRNGKPDANTVVITGVITKYEEGSKSLRFWIGMGAGSSFFESNVHFRDNKGASVGMIRVDKNSWALGGGIAAHQTPETFMDGAADKIAEEAGKLAK